MRRRRPSAAPATHRSKYGAIRTQLDGYNFASRREARVYGELKLREKAGEIKNLELQQRWALDVNGERVGVYVSDFQFHERGGIGGWTFVVADAKGVRLSMYVLKKKLMKAIHGIEVREL